MGIGVSIFLLAVGAILTFAVNATVSGVDINVVGWVLMAAGVAGLIIFAALFSRSRTRVADRVVERRPVAGERVVERDVL